LFVPYGLLHAINISESTAAAATLLNNAQQNNIVTKNSKSFFLLIIPKIYPKNACNLLEEKITKMGQAAALRFFSEK
jgi:hypothetical protein